MNSDCSYIPIPYDKIIFQAVFFLTESGIEPLWKVIENYRFFMEGYRKLRMEEELLTYEKFFQLLYFDEKDGMLKTNTTTWQIPKFFAETVLSTEEYRKKLPQDDFSYDKWFQGNASPRNHWNNMAKDYNEKRLVEALLSDLDDANIPRFLEVLGIDLNGEQVDRELLCTAIAQQFKAIIDGKGKASHIICDVILSGNIKADFMDYIHKAEQRYNVMKLIGGDEVPLDKFFVCNTIAEKERVFADKKKIKCEYLDDPDLESIRRIYSKRGYDNRLTVLIGSGGCGKSLMLQHLFLKAAADYKKTGVLPIFLELRYFTQGEDLMSFIVKTVSAKDSKFTEDAARRLLLSGRCQLLLDGFDEVDPTDIDSFLAKIQDFILTYEDVQIVVTSRGNEYITGLRGFSKLYVWPFDSNQSLRLIDKILKYQGQTEEKQTVLDYVTNGFLQKDGVFASHPLLLTYVTMEYPAYKKYSDNHIYFYKSMFKALVSGHDDNKKPYDRVFMSVDNATQFETVFREFCAITYKDGALQFTSTSFEDYFNKLKTYKSFKNPYKMNIDNFMHDVFSTACMMYESLYDIYYIDPGFQEYLFAEYYAQAEKEEVVELQESLSRIPYTKLLRFDALDMLCNSSEIKFKMYVLLPFLDSIFKGSDEEAFMNFLSMCFDKVNIVDFDEAMKVIFLHNLGIDSMLYPTVENYPNSILLNYILRMLGLDHEYAYTLYSCDNVPADGELKRLNITDDMEVTGVLIAQSINLEGAQRLLIDCKPMYVYELFNSQEQKGEKTGYLIDEEKKLIPFGAEYTIDSYYLSTNSEEYKELVENVITNSKDTYSMFQRIKAYYKELRLEKHHSGLK